MAEAARDALIALLAARSRGASICPSEVARAISSDDDWRKAMPSVHSAVDALLDEHRIELSWKGQSLKRRSGPYRISSLRDRS